MLISLKSYREFATPAPWTATDYSALLSFIAMLELDLYLEPLRPDETIKLAYSVPDEMFVAARISEEELNEDDLASVFHVSDQDRVDLIFDARAPHWFIWFGLGRQYENLDTALSAVDSRREKLRRKVKGGNHDL